MAAKPIIFCIDDDPQVLSAITRDLRYQYSNQFRILRAASGLAVLETLAELQQRQGTVALFLTDQQMPYLSGIEFLTQVRQLYPDAKRALLTAYAESNAVLAALQSSIIEQYLLKPWDPPEEALYPALNALLDDWQSAICPAIVDPELLETTLSARHLG